MNAEEIRKTRVMSDAGNYQMGAVVAAIPFLREIAAQLAELNENLKYLAGRKL